jgi:hypothetical protein
MNSKQWIFIAVIFFPLQASAQWVKYEQSVTGGFIAFYDPTSVKPEGDFRSVLILKNFNAPLIFNAEEPHFRYSSTIATQLINCANNSYKNNRIQIWSLQNGAGDLKKNYNYSDKNNWEKVKTGSIQESLTQKICFNT